MRLGSPRILAVIVAAALAGGAAGAGAYALFNSGGDTTVVRQVHVTQSLQAAARSGSTLSVGSIYKLAYRGVVKISVTSNGSSPFEQAQRSQGSGFVTDTNGHIVTNQHVVDGAESITVTFWNGETHSATLVAATRRPTRPSSRSMRLPRCCTRSPSAIRKPSRWATESSRSESLRPRGNGDNGIVSALHRQMTAPNNFTIDDSIQTDAAINHGNSGGPLLNMQGQVIGITAQIESDSGGNDGVGFAVPSNTARAIATKLVATGKVEHAYLGVSLGAAANGVRLRSICPSAPAAKAGLRVDDVITFFAGKKASSVDALRFAVDAKHPGDIVTVTSTRRQDQDGEGDAGSRPATTC